MPAYNFKERFVPWVKDGTKTGTIRDFRKYRVLAGHQLAHLFYGMRTKYCMKLVEPSPVIKKVRIVVLSEKFLPIIIETDWIAPENRYVFGSDNWIETYLVQRDTEYKTPNFLEGIEWTVLPNIAAADRFAWQDGFRHSDLPNMKKGCYKLMLRYWKLNGTLPYVGQHIIWGNDD